MSKARGRPRTQDQLTPAEWTVVNALRHGLSNPAIAKRLAVSLDAVKYHVSNAMQKLGFVGRAQLRVWDGVAQQTALADYTKVMLPDHSRKITMTTVEKPTPAPTRTEVDQLGAIAQIARVVADIEAARHWYGEVAGLEHIYSFGKMAFFNCAGLRLMLTEVEGGMKFELNVLPRQNKKPKRAQALASRESILYFRVVDIHGAQKALAARGAIFVTAPHLVHRHSDGTEEWMAFFQDNEARPLALVAQIKPSNANATNL
jgi:DNA-binding CsgD family transcriptional regulator/catechol 2,3-dioxygenase-like lactoylglutathione lyase family enzyme